MTFVLAGNHNEFVYWCRENKRSIRSQDVVSVHSQYALCGYDYKGAAFVRYGTWYRQPKELIDYFELIEKLRGV